MDFGFQPKHVVLFLFSSIVLGILVSPFLLSISYIGLIICSLFSQGSQTWHSLNVSKYWQNFRKVPLLWPYLIYFGLIAVDYVAGPKNDWALTHLRIQLPFLLLPPVFANLPRLTKKDLVHFGYAFLGIVTIINLLVFVNYLLNKSAIDLSIRMGKSIPTPYSHIRHAILTATAILFALKSWFWRKKVSGVRILWILAFFQFLFLHFLAVRSGLMLVYVYLAGFILYLIWLERRWKEALGLVSLLLVLALASVRLIPSLENKLAYMWYDLQQSKANKGALYADSNRLKSLELAWYHIKEKPISGYRIGQIKEKMEASYRRIPGYQGILPHSQYVFWLMGLGIILGGILIGVLWFPLFEIQQKFYFFFVLHNLGLFASMLVENTLLTAMGVAIFLFFSCWAIRFELSPVSFKEDLP